MQQQSPSPGTAPVVTIDGPSGTGKGTIAKLVADSLGWHILDSGALYRLVALASGKHQVDLDDAVALSKIALELDVEFKSGDSGAVEIWLEGERVGDQLRTEETGNMASKLAAYPQVRQALMDRQRAFCCAPGLVADGRDMGTVIFPQAQAKIYLTASAEERARRRHKQLKEKGINANIRALSDEISERDERDSSRSIAPLRPAEDAIVIDTSAMTIDEVVEQVMAAVHK